MYIRFCLFLLSLLLFPCLASCTTSSYVENPQAIQFSKHMVDQYGFDPKEMQRFIAQLTPTPKVIEFIRPHPSGKKPSWQAYRNNVINSKRIQYGLQFWREYQSALEEAERIYHVPAEIIVAILGIETNYGRYTGNFETASALATLAFDYPPRSELFSKELENLLLLAKEQQQDVFQYRGSFAGAIGYPQFLPSSIRKYAVDFDHDGIIDLQNSPVDAIGSIANYFQQHGWQAEQPVAVRVEIPTTYDASPLIDLGIQPSIQPEQLREAGIQRSDKLALANLPAALIDLQSNNQATEFWLGYQNFYVITRYNKSSFYAMTVFQFAQILKQSHR